MSNLLFLYMYIFHLNFLDISKNLKWITSSKEKNIPSKLGYIYNFFLLEYIQVHFWILLFSNLILLFQIVNCFFYSIIFKYPIW